MSFIVLSRHSDKTRVKFNTIMYLTYTICYQNTICSKTIIIALDSLTPFPSHDLVLTLHTYRTICLIILNIPSMCISHLFLGKVQSDGFHHLVHSGKQNNAGCPEERKGSSISYGIVATGRQDDEQQGYVLLTVSADDGQT